MRDGSPSRFVSLVLLIIALFLVFIIASGTVWACVRGSGSKGPSSGKPLFSRTADSSAIEAARNAGESAKTALFSDIGPLRAATADGDGTVIVIEPHFPYPAGDIAFREELVKKTRTARAWILDWFAARSVRELKSLGEEGVKKAIIDGVNGLLVLGSLDAVWFSEFMVLD